MKHDPDKDWIQRDHADQRKRLLLDTPAPRWDWRDWLVWTLDKSPLLMLLALLAYVLWQLYGGGK